MAAWSPSPCLPHTPRSQKGQIVKWKGRRGKDGQWMMERLTGVETVGREAESETSTVNPIIWNKSNGFSSLKTDWMFDKKWEKVQAWNCFKIKNTEDTMKITVLRESYFWPFLPCFHWPDRACFSCTIACWEVVRCILAGSLWGISALNCNIVVLFWSSAKQSQSLPLTRPWGCVAEPDS